MIQMAEDGTGIMGELVPESSHQGAGVHGRLQSLAAHVAHDDHHRAVFDRKHLEEVAAHAIGRHVGALQYEVTIGWKLGGDEHSLHAACRRDLRIGTLLLLADADKAVKNDRNEAGEKDRVGDEAGAEFDGAKMEAVKG